MTDIRDELGGTSIVEAESYKIVARASNAGEFTVRIERPCGTGRPLYDTIQLSHDEAVALARLLKYETE